MKQYDINISHDLACQIAYKWMMHNCSVGCGFIEAKSVSPEVPDVIGFGSGNHSVLIEAKVGRRDFLKDKSKPHRANPAEGMGLFRYYICPMYLIKPEEVPEGWGLLYINDLKKVVPVITAYPYQGGTIGKATKFEVKNDYGERNILYSQLRKQNI